MSIRDVEKARQRQLKQRAEVRSKEAEARPDAVHRAVVFLLRAAKENNPDLTEEANHHIGSLDAELAKPEKLAEIEKPPANEDPDPTQEDDDEDAPPAAPNTAAAIRQSRRFKRS